MGHLVTVSLQDICSVLSWWFERLIPTRHPLKITCTPVTESTVVVVHYIASNNVQYAPLACLLPRQEPPPPPPPLTSLTWYCICHWLSTYLSPPICSSSNSSQRPKTSSVMSFTEVWIAPPQAFRVLLKSSSVTRPAQNMSLQQTKSATGLHRDKMSRYYCSTQDQTAVQFTSTITTNSQYNSNCRGSSMNTFTCIYNDTTTNPSKFTRVQKDHKYTWMVPASVGKLLAKLAFMMNLYIIQHVSFSWPEATCIIL